MCDCCGLKARAGCQSVRHDIVRCISVGGGKSYRYKYDVYVVDLGKDANFGAVLDDVDP